MNNLETLKAQIVAKRDELVALQSPELDELQVFEFPETSGCDMLSIETNVEERFSMILFANFVICRITELQFQSQEKQKESQK